MNLESHENKQYCIHSNTVTELMFPLRKISLIDFKSLSDRSTPMPYHKNTEEK